MRVPSPLNEYDVVGRVQPEPSKALARKASRKIRRNALRKEMEKIADNGTGIDSDRVRTNFARKGKSRLQSVNLGDRRDRDHLVKSLLSTTNRCDAKQTSIAKSPSYDDLRYRHKQAHFRSLRSSKDILYRVKENLTFNPSSKLKTEAIADWENTDDYNKDHMNLRPRNKVVHSENHRLPQWNLRSKHPDHAEELHDSAGTESALDITKEDSFCSCSHILDGVSESLLMSLDNDKDPSLNQDLDMLSSVCNDTEHRTECINISDGLVKEPAPLSHNEHKWVIHHIQCLEDRIAAAEEALSQLKEESIQNQTQFSEDVARLRNILGTVDQAQKIRYKSVISVFTENFHALGQFETRMEDLVCSKQRYSRLSIQSSFQIFGWYVMDCAFILLITVTRAISSLVVVVYRLIVRNDDKVAG